MIDGIIKQTGNSRYLKSAITEATTWEQFRAALIAGTLPIDLNGINAAGWQTLATALSKANLLSDSVAAAIKTLAGLSANPDTPNAALSAIATAVAAGAKIATGSYVGTGTYGSANPCSLTFDKKPYLVIVTAASGNTVYFAAITATYGVFLSEAQTLSSPTGARLISSVTGNTITYYSDSANGFGATCQCNISGTAYTYTAFLD